MADDPNVTPAPPVETFTMTLSLGVIDHLGLNLYSNIPAVLSELVANAWDADARNVDITLDRSKGEIMISDDGHGMTVDDVNNRFLRIGYRRREQGPSTTASGRHVMGRKGIGKLSTFSIAHEVEVQTVATGCSPCGFIMRSSDIREQIAEGTIGDYHPEEIKPANLVVTAGTRLNLRSLRKQLTTATGRYLRRRIARRFSVIGPKSNFAVKIDGELVSVTDRDYFNNLEYLWSIGSAGDVYASAAINAKQKSYIPGRITISDLDIKDEQKKVLRDFEKKAGEIKVSGWIGTFTEQSNIEDGDNSVVVLAWGKLIHEDVLKDSKSGGLFTKYVIGEIEADFLDYDRDDDIVTSSRQSVNEDDPRFVAFKQWFERVVLRTIGSKWRDWRRDQAVDKATENPAVRQWYDTLTPTSKSFAKKLLGKIGGFPLEDEGARKELYRHTILAFERLRFRDMLSEIEKLGDDFGLTGFDVLFQTIDDLEAAHYHEMASGRMEVIRAFQKIVSADEKEKVIQKYLFDHLWLLHPSWDRAATDKHMEKTVQAALGLTICQLTEEEKRGRFDIAFKTAPDRHVVIELKRYSARLTTSDLFAQLAKYQSAIRKALDLFPDKRQFEIVAVLGQPPHDVDRDPSQRALSNVGARWVTYDELIGDALNSYGDYLAAHEKISELAKLLDKV